MSNYDKYDDDSFFGDNETHDETRMIVIRQPMEEYDDEPTTSTVTPAIPVEDNRDAAAYHAYTHPSLVAEKKTNLWMAAAVVAMLTVVADIVMGLEDAIIPMALIAIFLLYKALQTRKAHLTPQ